MMLMQLQRSGFVAVPKSEIGGRHLDASEWQAAIAALILVTRHGGDMMLPRIGMKRALRGLTKAMPRVGRRTLGPSEQCASGGQRRNEPKAIISCYIAPSLTVQFWTV
jgi:hypothetical protein